MKKYICILMTMIITNAIILSTVHANNDVLTLASLGKWSNYRTLQVSKPIQKKLSLNLSRQFGKQSATKHLYTAKSSTEYDAQGFPRAWDKLPTSNSSALNNRSIGYSSPDNTKQRDTIMNKALSKILKTRFEYQASPSCSLSFGYKEGNPFFEDINSESWVNTAIKTNLPTEPNNKQLTHSVFLRVEYTF